MKHKSKTLLAWLFVIVTGIALGCWVYSRWDIWFDNPPEQPYTVTQKPDRVMLTFGDEGELSRYVSWICDTIVDPCAQLLLATENDTIVIAAKGEVFHSRAGKAVYYRAHLDALSADQEYAYAVETGGFRSAWYHFRTHNPSAQSFSFLYMGDVQDTIGSPVDTLLRHVISLHPEVEFLTFGGDLVERPTDQHWELLFRNLHPVCTELPVLNITGNHDYLKSLVYHSERRFGLVFPYFLRGMAERDDQNHLFALRYHDTDLMLLDSNRGIAFLAAQRQWFKEQIGHSTARHRVLLLHHPVYSIRNKNNNLMVRWMFNDLIQEGDFDLVLQGHEHAYAHCTSDESPLTQNQCTRPPLYVISHCSPKNYQIRPTARFYPILNDSRYYQVITVMPESVLLRSYDAVGDVLIDSVRITKDNL